MLRHFFIFFFCGLTMIGCVGGNDEKIYNNADFGFSLAYPAGYQAQELKWIKEATGVTLTKGNSVITVQALPTGANYANLSFEQYVPIAATVDIQNFQKILSQEVIISDYGIKGYKTYWEVMEHEDTDRGANEQIRRVGPIYYFPLSKEKKLGAQPVKAIMLTAASQGGATEEAVLAELASSFRYTNSVVSLLGKKSHGKTIFVRQGRPFSLELAANPTTGYNWYFSGLDEKTFKIRDSGFHPPAARLVGAGGVSYWKIVPLKKGIAHLRLRYYRSWEGESSAVDEYSLRVIVL